MVSAGLGATGVAVTSLSFPACCSYEAGILENPKVIDQSCLPLGSLIGNFTAGWGEALSPPPHPRLSRHVNCRRREQGKGTFQGDTGGDKVRGGNKRAIRGGAGGRAAAGAGGRGPSCPLPAHPAHFALPSPPATG